MGKCVRARAGADPGMDLDDRHLWNECDENV